jgi:hypothetical protein
VSVGTGGPGDEEPSLEVLAGGRERGSGRPSSSPWRRRWGRLTRRQQRLVSTGVLVVVAAATATYAYERTRPPGLPPVSVASDRPTESVPLWSAGQDGRPVAPVTLSVSAQLSAPGGPRAAEVFPVGLAGPGVHDPGAFPRHALGRTPTDIELTAQVDCDQVPIPVPQDAYAIRLRVVDGARTAGATTPLGPSEPELRRRVTLGCATWLGARDLTITAVRATVDPTQPHVDLVLDVRNAGSRSAVVWTGGDVGGGTRVTDVRAVLPARSSVSVPVSVDLPTCFQWPDAGSPATAGETPLGLLGAVGVDTPLSPTELPPSQGDIGVPLAPAVAVQLRAALVAACGGIASPVLLTSPTRTTYDADTHLLTAHIVADLPPGLPVEARFLPAGAGQTDLRPLFGPTPWLHPDYSGQLGYTVRFAVPPDVPCLGGGPFVTLDVEARVGQRVVRFTLAAEVLLPEREIEAACGG